MWLITIKFFNRLTVLNLTICYLLLCCSFFVKLARLLNFYVVATVFFQGEGFSCLSAPPQMEVSAHRSETQMLKIIQWIPYHRQNPKNILELWDSFVRFIQVQWMNVLTCTVSSSESKSTSIDLKILNISIFIERLLTLIAQSGRWSNS